MKSLHWNFALALAYYGQTGVGTFTASFQIASLIHDLQWLGIKKEGKHCQTMLDLPDSHGGVSAMQKTVLKDGAVDFFSVTWLELLSQGEVWSLKSKSQESLRSTSSNGTFIKGLYLLNNTHQGYLYQAKSYFQTFNTSFECNFDLYPWLGRASHLSTIFHSVTWHWAKFMTGECLGL